MVNHTSLADQRIPLGRCFKSHGLKGGYLLQLYNSQASSLRKGQKLFFSPLQKTSELPAEGRWMTLTQISAGPKTLAYFEGVVDRTMAEKLLPFTFSIERSDLPPLTEAGEYYICDLLGLPVFNFLSGIEEGVVADFYDNSAQIVLIIQRKQGGQWELPFTEGFFPLVDVQARRISIRLPEMIEGSTGQ